MQLTLILCAAIFAASYYAWQNPTVQERWTLHPYSVRQGKGLFTLLTSGLIHADMTHLLFNLITLYFFGTSLENYYMALGLPSYLMLVLWVTGVIAANIATTSIYYDRPGYRSLGASGGVEAVLFATILLNPKSDICLYFILCVPAWIGALLFLAYGIYQSRSGRDNVNHVAHLAGAAFGVLFQYIVYPSSLILFWRQLVG